MGCRKPRRWRCSAMRKAVPRRAQVSLGLHTARLRRSALSHPDRAFRYPCLAPRATLIFCEGFHQDCQADAWSRAEVHRMKGPHNNQESRTLQARRAHGLGSRAPTDTISPLVRRGASPPLRTSKPYRHIAQLHVSTPSPAAESNLHRPRVTTSPAASKCLSVRDLLPLVS